MDTVSIIIRILFFWLMLGILTAAVYGFIEELREEDYEHREDVEEGS